MLDFAARLPVLRARVSEDLADERLGRERLLACAIRLLDRGFFRVGGESYADENGTFGLATLQRRHVRVSADGTILFSYPAKGGQLRRLLVVDDDVLAVLRHLKRRRGPTELLAYRNGTGWVDVRSVDINEYIQETSDGPFSAKDFRTWHATVLAALAVAVLGRRVRSETERRRIVIQASKEVARYLGNTPAVCRNSYIDPRVFELFYSGKTISVELEALAERDAIENDLHVAESAVVELLSDA